MISQTSVVNADHVLLQHKSHIVRRTNNDISSRSEVGHFLFDEGTSMFDSSLMADKRNSITLLPSGLESCDSLFPHSDN